MQKALGLAIIGSAAQRLIFSPAGTFIRWMARSPASDAGRSGGVQSALVATVPSGRRASPRPASSAAETNDDDDEQIASNEQPASAARTRAHDLDSRMGFEELKALRGNRFKLRLWETPMYATAKARSARRE